MESKEALKQYVQTEEGAKDQNAWYKLGSIYRKEENWGEALNAYAKCLELGAFNAAREATESIKRILDFRDTTWMP
ncbi:MAG: tetratricopeptide repeat protein [Bacteroidales bacterium]|jgi:cytochrome c-type biogenesis protein CcmH/NrfG|nr:tetratricopeptide repeat protein [Bacteroidales bacterium]HHV40659.1 hypothetical protein [Bacteroidales bacterium]